MSGTGVPTLRGLDHFGFTVPDLNEAVAFFVDHFHGTLAYESGPNTDATRSWMSQRIDVDPESSQRLAVVRIGEHTNFEIFEYATPGQDTSWPANSDLGGHHIGFYVEDIDVAAQYLAGVPGVTLLEGPNDVTEGPVRGERWLYFRTPWGQQLELTSCATPGYFEGLPGARKARPPVR